ncbi:MAG: VanW family protein [Lachnospiraceae bacterium]|nr:VanW family protein [Lachnospiraceae bacterium]
MKKKIRNILTLFMLTYVLCGNVDTVEAAQVQQPKLSGLTFDMDYYYNKYPDLQVQIGYDYNGLYNHYIEYGLREGRWGSGEFNCLTYKNNYIDLQVAFGNNYNAYCTHYEVYGKAEGRNAERNVMEENVNTGQIKGNVIGSYSTLYDPNVPRAINVTLAASRINGMVIQPGASFSFNQTILPRTAENGYVEAPVIVGKGYAQGFGGGICQVSSTLYAAMLSANLPATERHPHSLLVSYIPAGMDATISGNVKDLKFTNIFEEAIQIYASADNGVLTVTLYK